MPTMFGAFCATTSRQTPAWAWLRSIMTLKPSTSEPESPASICRPKIVTSEPPISMTATVKRSVQATETSPP